MSRISDVPLLRWATDGKALGVHAPEFDQIAIADNGAGTFLGRHYVGFDEVETFEPLAKRKVVFLPSDGSPQVVVEDTDMSEFEMFLWAQVYLEELGHDPSEDDRDDRISSVCARLEAAGHNPRAPMDWPKGFGLVANPGTTSSKPRRLLQWLLRGIPSR